MRNTTYRLMISAVPLPSLLYPPTHLRQFPNVSALQPNAQETWRGGRTCRWCRASCRSARLAGA